jgi:pimeloyl-ACP methyl ester carboxylesterase
MYATQGPTNGAVFGEKVNVAAWENKPSWYIVSEQDHMLDTDLQKAMAKKIHASVISLNASHAPIFLSQMPWQTSFYRQSTR